MASVMKQVSEINLKVVERAPEWIRKDLAGGDASARVRAEEALAAMIADAIAKTNPQYCGATPQA
ncbi:hypothetical protein [Novosphingobium sp. KN65.2]|uniref:hypothetical protein n=1 Tax=Novosphingobium sp. KN65.2 TaxID=1478134 RepID=UPI0005E3D3E4|nr:hypothetical protein [Novosphingobium sp. KN65.2]CDO34532.1 hypothetical protein SPHV1_1630001 [Novosphingobium sp. KN65.2]